MLFLFPVCSLMHLYLTLQSQWYVSHTNLIMSLPCLKYFSCFLLPSKWKPNLLAWFTQGPPWSDPCLFPLACLSRFHTVPYIPSSSFREVPAPSLLPAIAALISSLFCPSSLLYLPNLNSFFKITLSEISQTEKDKYHTISLICEI